MPALRDIANHLGILVLVFSISCSQIEETVEPLDVARHLLNQRRYDEATELLVSLRRASPDDDYLKLLLASSLAGSVGIDAIESFEALKDKLFDEPLINEATKDYDHRASRLVDHSNKDNDSFDSDNNQTQSIKEFEQSLLDFLSLSRDAAEIAFHLAHLQKDDRPTVMRSIALLSGIGEESEHYVVGQIYKSVLNMVQFLNYLRDAVPYSKGEEKENWYHALYCNLQVDIFMTNISRAATYLSTAFTSLHNAQRKSGSAVYKNLLLAKNKLNELNAFYINHQGAFTITDLTHDLTKPKFCR